MNILIFGAGAVGQAVGCVLAAGGHAVDLIVRERFITKIEKDGLTVTGIMGDFHSGPGSLGLHSTIDTVTENAYDYVLVTTKSYDTESALSELAKLRNQRFFAVSMQNGCGNLELFVEQFGEERSLGARVITGFEIESPGTVTITVSADDIHIADLCLQSQLSLLL